jgi:hypothetical protein
MPGLSANQHISAALDHKAGAAAVLVAIAQAVGLQIIDQDSLATGNCDPGIRVTTLRVPAGIADAQGGARVDLYVGRAGLRRANTHMRALRAFMVIIRRNLGIVTEPRLRLHCMLGIYHITGSAAVGAA